MKPSHHLRWSAERLLDIARQERRALAAQRREAVTALASLPLLYGLSVLGHAEVASGSAIPSFQALATVALIAALVLWFRLLGQETEALPSIDVYAGSGPVANEKKVRARLQTAREDLVKCCRLLRAAVVRGAAQRQVAWRASLVALLLMLLVLALRGLA